MNKEEQAVAEAIISLELDRKPERKNRMIALNTTTIMVLDADTAEVRFAEYDGSLDQLYLYTKCDLVDTIRLDRNHIIFVDDEGLLKDYTNGWKLEYQGRTITIVGSAVILGDRYGETAPLTLNPSDLKISHLTYEGTEEEDV